MREKNNQKARQGIGFLISVKKMKNNGFLYVVCLYGFKEEKIVIVWSLSTLIRNA